MGDTATHPGRGPMDPYTFPPGTPQTPSAQMDDPFLAPGPQTSEAYHGMRYPGGSPQMRHPMTPPNMNQGQSYPGSPRIPEPGFRWALCFFFFFNFKGIAWGGHKFVSLFLFFMNVYGEE